MATDIIARGLAAQTAAAVEALPKGIVYRGAVDYEADLPNNAEIGDAYTVKYKGTSGTEPSGAEFVWGNYEGTNQWIEIGKSVEGTDVKSTNATAGQFLCADGNGGAAWVTIPLANGQSF